MKKEVTCFYLIDAAEQEIKVMNQNTELYDIVNYKTFLRHKLPNGDYLLTDGDDTPKVDGIGWFTFCNSKTFANNAIVCSFTNENDFQNPKIELQELQKYISFESITELN